MLEAWGVLSTAKVGRRRAVEPPISKRDVHKVAKGTMHTLGEALAPSTWRGLEATHRRLLQFRTEWWQTTGVELGWDLTVMHWVQRLLMEGDITIPSALEYVLRAQGALKRLGHPVDSQLLRDFTRALRRQGAMRPHRQAVAATEAQVLSALEAEPDRDTQLAIVLAWSGAARVSDVVRLRVRDVTFEDGFVAVNWSDTKSDPFRLGVTTGLHLTAEWTRRLRDRLTGRPGAEVILDTDYRKLVRALKRVDGELTGHSLRRGALLALLDENVRMDVIRQVSRHSSLDALARYLPAGKLAIARTSAEASRLLGANL